MKKRALTVILAGVLACCLAACGSSANSTQQTAGNGGASAQTQTQTGTTQNAPDVNPVELLFHPAKSGSYATIKVDSTVQMDDESAWLGLCPAGKDYITELEADEVDVIWFNADAREADSDPYVFACDFESVEDGTYALVVATSDDENVGYVAIQLTMEKKGDSLTFDYTDAKIKERPAK